MNHIKKKKKKKKDQRMKSREQEKEIDTFATHKKKGLSACFVYTARKEKVLKKTNSLFSSSSPSFCFLFCFRYVEHQHALPTIRVYENFVHNK